MQSGALRRRFNDWVCDIRELLSRIFPGINGVKLINLVFDYDPTMHTLEQQRADSYLMTWDTTCDDGCYVRFLLPGRTPEGIYKWHSEIRIRRSDAVMYNQSDDLVHTLLPGDEILGASVYGMDKGRDPKLGVAFDHADPVMGQLKEHPCTFDLQFASDLHLEHSCDDFKSLIEPNAPYLALLGDIGRLDTVDNHETYKRFLKYVSTRFVLVFLVPGNHEYYSLKGAMTMRDVDIELQRLCDALPNVKYLNRQSWCQEEFGIRVVGATLWSDVPSTAETQVAGSISDYKCIYNQRRRAISVRETNTLHRQHVAFIHSELKQAEAKHQYCIVLTHHAPLMKGTSDPAFERQSGRALNHAFASNLSRLFRPALKVWAFGHTHYSAIQEVNGVAVVSNQKGYGPSGSNVYSRTLKLEIPLPPPPS